MPYYGKVVVAVVMELEAPGLMSGGEYTEEVETKR